MKLKLSSLLLLLSLCLSPSIFAASGDTLVVFTPGHAELPSSAAATFDTRAGASNAVHLVLDFDDATDETAEFAGFMPRHYDGGGVTVTVGWMATTATTGTISLDVSFKSVTDDADDLDTKAFAAANNANPTTASATGEVDYVTRTFTDGADMDSVAAGEYFRLRVTRDGDGTTSTDNMTGDMELVFVEIQET